MILRAGLRQPRTLRTRSPAHFQRSSTAEHGKPGTFLKVETVCSHSNIRDQRRKFFQNQLGRKFADRIFNDLDILSFRENYLQTSTKLFRNRQGLTMPEQSKKEAKR